jgi:hypothetical protein
VAGELDVSWVWVAAVMAGSLAEIVNLDDDKMDLASHLDTVKS